MGTEGRDDRRLSDYEPERPSLIGALALAIAAAGISVVAILVFVGALESLVPWTSNNTPGTILTDAFFLAIAVWADRRAISTWKRLRDSGDGGP